MSAFGRSFKPSYLRARPPGLSGRSMSNSSDVSVASSAGSEDQFVLSGANTPAKEKPPSRGRTTANAAEQDKSQYAPYQPNSPRHTRPIAIEPSARRFRAGSTSAYTPPEPLSGRGDLPGGYFPNHEDKPRVYRPHPFHKASQEARQRSIALAAEESSPDSGGAASSPFASSSISVGEADTLGAMPPQRLHYAHGAPGAVSHLSAAIDASRAASSSSSHHGSPAHADSNNTPVASYMPAGQDNPLPVGKYYPSNYECRTPATTAISPSLRPPRLAQGSKSDLQVPQHKAAGTVDADARRRLLQYQRDMVAQATQAASRVLGRKGAGSAGGVHLGVAAAVGAQGKPTSPRLAPLGSPGPVTPINLEEESGGYLSKGRSAEAGGEERRRRGPPPGEAGRERLEMSPPVLN